MSRIEEYKEVWILRSLRAVVDWITRSPWRYFPLIFLVSLTIRIHPVNQLLRFNPLYLAPSGNREVEAIAISLYRTGEFANPYVLPTGLTAHLPPLVPWMESLIYRIFGLTPKAGYVSALLIIVTASTLYGMLPWFSGQIGIGKVAGLMGGLIGALGGLEKTLEDQLPGHAEYMTALVLGLVMVAFVRRWRGQDGGWIGSYLLGIGIGVAFHIQPALLPVILGFLLVELWWRRHPRRWLPAGVVALGIVTACLPWAWRNYQTFQAIFFIRSNFGLELRMGNNDTALATFEEMDAISTHYPHPRASFLEARKVLEVGEIEYMRQARNKALAWIKSHATRFLSLTAQRIANLWIGPPKWLKYFTDVLKLTFLALVGVLLIFPKLNHQQRATLLIPLAAYPLIYYILGYMPRYRIPINWIFYILAGVVAWKLVGEPFDPAIKDSHPKSDPG